MVAAVENIVNADDPTNPSPISNPETKLATDESPPSSMTTHQYAETYRTWMYQQQLFQQINMAYFNLFSMLSIFNYNTLISNSQMVSVRGEQQQQQGATEQQTLSPAVTNTNTTVPQRNVPRRIGRQCQIPPIWMRLAAEIIDFFILFILKLAGSIIIFDYIEIIDLDSYSLEKLVNMNWDSQLAQNITSDLIIFELTNRLFVSVFEALCLRRGAPGEIGGSTPGKKLLGLRVVLCFEVVRVDDKKIIVYPANDLNFINSLMRSVLKNFSYIFFIPMPLTALLFLHNRTAYDVIGNSVVVYLDDSDSRQFRRVN